MRGGESRLPLFIVALQFITSLVVAAGLLLVDNTQAVAAMLAGGVCVGPGGYFAWRAVAERSPGRLLGQGVMKFLLTMTSMALVFILFKPAPLGFFASFMAMQTMYVFGPLAFGTRAET
jgi:hypothetical protein